MSSPDGFASPWQRADDTTAFSGAGPTAPPGPFAPPGPSAPPGPYPAPGSYPPPGAYAPGRYPSPGPYPPPGAYAPGGAYMPPPGAYNPYAYGPPVAPARTNGLAIASLVCSCSAVVVGATAPVGLVLGIVALIQLNRDDQLGGRGMALAGLIVGAVFTLIGLAFVVLYVVLFATLSTSGY